MNTTTDGGPAFPVQALASPGSEIAWGMLSLRDWFAGQALAGMLAAVGPLKADPRVSQADVETMIATASFRTADAMLRARERGQEGGAR